MPDQVPDEVKRERIERLIEVVQRVAADAERRAGRRGRGGARRGAEPHRPDAPARPHAAQHDRQLRRHAQPPASSFASRSTGRRSTTLRGRHGRDSRLRSGNPRPRLGRLPERPRPRRPADRGRRRDALRLGDPCRQRRSADRRRLAGAPRLPACTRIVDLRGQVEIDDDPPRELPTSRSCTCPCSITSTRRTGRRSEPCSEAAPSHAAATELVYLRFLEQCRPSFVEGGRGGRHGAAGRSSSTARRQGPHRASSRRSCCGWRACRPRRSPRTTRSSAQRLAAAASTEWLADAAGRRRARADRTDHAPRPARRCRACSTPLDRRVRRRRAVPARRRPRDRGLLEPLGAARAADDGARDLRPDRERQERGRRGDRAADPGRAGLRRLGAALPRACRS